MANMKKFLDDMKARKRGVQVAREWFERTGDYEMPGEEMLEIAESRGWPAKGDDWRARVYINAVGDELDRLAGLPPLWEGD